MKGLIYLYPRKCDFCGKGMEKGIMISQGEYYCDEKCCYDQHKDNKCFPIGENDTLVTYKEFLQVLDTDIDDELFNGGIYEWYSYTEWFIEDNGCEYGYDIFGNKCSDLKKNNNKYWWEGKQNDIM